MELKLSLRNVCENLLGWQQGGRKSIKGRGVCRCVHIWMITVDLCASLWAVL